MLADDLLVAPYASTFHRAVFEEVKRAVASAVRFVLDREVVTAAHLVTEAMPSSILQGLPLCRLPYPTTWFEYAGNDRPGFAELGSAIPHRVGLLCEAAPDSSDELTAHVIWRNERKGGSLELCPVALLIDLSPEGCLARDPKVALQKRGAVAEGLQRVLLASNQRHNLKIAANPRELEAALALSNRTFFVTSRYFAPLARAVIEHAGAAALEQLLTFSRANAESEAGLLLGILMLLNTRNGTTRQPADLVELNAARVKRGVRPLLEHWTLTLRLSEAQSRSLARAGVAAHEMRAHLVRGHFKIRRTGIYWWSPHIRGDAKLGTIHKAYRVKR
jgi:predicted component of type VI protein secretion system